VKAKFNPSTGDTSTTTEAAHILPSFSLISADTNTSDFSVLAKLLIVTAIQLFKKCTIWSVIKSFTSIEFKELSGDNINSLTNVITLDTCVHRFFGPLYMWFEAVPMRCILLCYITIDTLSSHKG